MPVIEVTNLHKRYGDTVAVDDVSFGVEEGEIFGILGPNGAGKTTTVECVEGLRAPDRGRVSVLGLDPRRDRAELTQRVGVQLQQSDLPEKMKVAEAIALYGSFYRRPADGERLIDELGLMRQARHPVRQAVRRPEAARVDRTRAGGQPRDRGARRADHRAGPAGAPGHLAAHRAGTGPGRHDPAGHTLHGGGRAALRPHRGDRLGPGRGDRHARRTRVPRRP